MLRSYDDFRRVRTARTPQPTQKVTTATAIKIPSGVHDTSEEPDPP